MSINNIIKNIGFLYTKDIELALNLLHNRKLYDLKELVDSSIIKLNRDMASKNGKADNLDKNKMLRLKESVDSYLIKIDPEYFDEEEYIEYYEDEEY